MTKELKTENILMRIEPSKKKQWQEAARENYQSLTQYIMCKVDNNYNK